MFEKQGIYKETISASSARKHQCEQKHINRSREGEQIGSDQEESINQRETAHRPGNNNIKIARHRDLSSSEGEVSSGRKTRTRKEIFAERQS
jgi:hypothetical protein